MSKGAGKSDRNKIKRLEDQAGRYANNSTKQRNILQRIDTLKNKK